MRLSDLLPPAPLSSSLKLIPLPIRSSARLLTYSAACASIVRQLLLLVLTRQSWQSARPDKRPVVASLSAQIRHAVVSGLCDMVL